MDALAPAGIAAGEERYSARVTVWSAVARHPLVTLYALALLPMLLLGARQPVFSVVDESAHYDYIAQLAHRTVPIHGTPVRPETLSLMQQTGVYRTFLDIPQPQASTIFIRPARDASPAAWALWSARHQWQWSAEAGTPPLYYVVSVPAWWLGDAVAGPMGAVAALRIENGLLAALLAPLLYLLVGELIGSRRRDIAVWTSLLAVSLPGIVMSLTSTTNNTLVTVASTALLLVCVRSLHRGWTSRRLLAAGALAGVAVATKSIAPGIAPAVVIALLWGVRTDGLSVVARRLGLVGAIAAVGLLPLFILSHGAFGLLSVSAAAPLTPPDPGVLPPTIGAVVNSVDNAVLTFAAGEPLGVTLPLATALLVLLSIGALAVLAVAVVRPRPVPRGEGKARLRGSVIVLCTAVVGQLGLSVVQLLLSHGVFAVPAPGRYIYPALGGAVGLAALALARTGLNSSRLRPGAVVLISASLLTLSLYSNRLFGAVHTVGSGQPSSLATAVAVKATAAQADGFSVRVDSIVKEGGGEWLHIIATNRGASAAEWLPMATATAGPATVAVTDYHHSSVILEQIQPGASTSGWLNMEPADGVALPPAFTLTFPDVATDSYRHVCTLAVTVALS